MLESSQKKGILLIIIGVCLIIPSQLTISKMKKLNKSNDYEYGIVTNTERVRKIHQVYFVSETDNKKYMVQIEANTFPKKKGDKIEFVCNASGKVCIFPAYIEGSIAAEKNSLVRKYGFFVFVLVGIIFLFKLEGLFKKEKKGQERVKALTGESYTASNGLPVHELEKMAKTAGLTTAQIEQLNVAFGGSIPDSVIAALAKNLCKKK
jgi:Ca2+/Na+ antiporter